MAEYLAKDSVVAQEQKVRLQIRLENRSEGVARPRRLLPGSGDP